jgi:predicted ester cyclase
MDPRFAVLRHFKGLQYKDLDDVADWLSDDLVFHTSIRSFNKAEILDFIDSIFDAFENWKFEHEDVLMNGEDVEMNVSMHGTHSNTLILDIPGLRPIAATNKNVFLPSQKLVFKVENDRITEVITDLNKDHGLWGLLRQIGVRHPTNWWLKIIWKKSKAGKTRKRAPALH